MSDKIDYVARLITRLPSQYKQSPVLMQWIGIFLEQCDILEDTFQQIQTSRRLDVAQNHQLDGLGDIIGETRAFDGAVRHFGFAGAPRLHGGFGDEDNFGSELVTAAPFADEYTKDDVNRINLSNPEYLGLLRARIIKNHTNCCDEDIIESIHYILMATPHIGILEEFAIKQVHITIDMVLTERQKQILAAPVTPIPRAAGIGYVFYDQNGPI